VCRTEQVGHAAVSLAPLRYWETAAQAFPTLEATCDVDGASKLLNNLWLNDGWVVIMQEPRKGRERSRQSEGPTQDIPAVNLASSEGAKEASAEASGKAFRVQPYLLTPEQEQLMVEHLPIVRFIARCIHERLPQHVPIEDLYSAGVLGLLDAFGRFDPSKEVKFRTYAQFRIRGTILDSLRTLDWSPRKLRRKGRAVEQAIQMLTGQLSRSPTEIEIAQKLNIPLAAYQQLLGELEGLEIGSLHAERSMDSDEEELDLIPGRPDDDPLSRYLNGEMRERLTTAINDLSERERLVLTLYYYEETTMKEIGLILGVVESRVWRIRASAVLHLRARLADFAMQEPPVRPARQEPSSRRPPFPKNA
jgi:RNA polymerase sigma factor for flagellar operon FliA